MFRPYLAMSDDLILPHSYSQSSNYNIPRIPTAGLDKGMGCLKNNDNEGSSLSAVSWREA